MASPSTMRVARSSWSWKTSFSPTVAVCDQTSVPPGASTSWVAARIWSPARRSVPVSTTSTSASDAIRFRSGSAAA